MDEVTKEWRNKRIQQIIRNVQEVQESVKKYKSERYSRSEREIEQDYDYRIQQVRGKRSFLRK